MFTGLIEGKGVITQVYRSAQGMELVIKPLFEMTDLKLGDSVAVSGACLTVTKIENDTFSVQLSPETIARTTFSNVQVGKKVNLERALRLGDRLGGHLVTGHVDTIGTVVNRQEKGVHTVFSFRLSSEWMRYVVEKGSIAVDGVSLTVNRCFKDGLEVNIIPHTAAVTTLGELKIGDKVNIETDLIGKYVAKFVSVWEEKQGITEDFLKAHGFF